MWFVKVLLGLMCIVAFVKVGLKQKKTCDLYFSFLDIKLFDKLKKAVFSYKAGRYNTIPIVTRKIVQKCRKKTNLRWVHQFSEAQNGKLIGHAHTFNNLIDGEKKMGTTDPSWAIFIQNSRLYVHTKVATVFGYCILDITKTFLNAMYLIEVDN